MKANNVEQKSEKISFSLRNSEKFKDYVSRRRKGIEILNIDGKDYLTFKRYKETVLEDGTLLYRFLAEKKYGRQIAKDELVHHIDGNHYNNDINNLQIVTISEHMSIHKKNRIVSEETRKKLSDAHNYRDPESYKRQGEKLKGRKHTEEHCLKLSNSLNSSAAFQAYKAKPMSDETCKRISESVRISQAKMRLEGKIPGQHAPLSYESRLAMAEKKKGLKLITLPDGTRKFIKPDPQIRPAIGTNDTSHKD